MSDLREAAKALLSHWDTGKRIGGALEALRSALAADEVSADLSAALAQAEKAEAEARRAITQLDDALGRLQTAHEERDALAARPSDAEQLARMVGYAADAYEKDAIATHARLAEVERERWQPIETAPRNSSRILVAYKNLYGEWKIHEAWWRIPYEAAPAERGYWCHDGNVTMLDSSVHSVGATHWMPLPLPPKDAALAREEKS